MVLPSLESNWIRKNKESVGIYPACRILKQATNGNTFTVEDAMAEGTNLKSSQSPGSN